MLSTMSPSVRAVRGAHSAIPLLAFSLLALLLYHVQSYIPSSIRSNAIHTFDSQTHASEKLSRPHVGCPSPYQATNSSVPSSQQYYAQSIDLKTTASEFEVKLCEPYLAKACNTFEVQVRRKSCSSVLLSQPLASSAIDDEFIKTQLGPDTFHVSVSGNELWASVTPYKYKDCSYHYIVPLSTGGGRLSSSHRMLQAQLLHQTLIYKFRICTNSTKGRRKFGKSQGSTTLTSGRNIR